LLTHSRKDLSQVGTSLLTMELMTCPAQTHSECTPSKMGKDFSVSNAGSQADRLTENAPRIPCSLKIRSSRHPPWGSPLHAPLLLLQTFEEFLKHLLKRTTFSSANADDQHQQDHADREDDADHRQDADEHRNGF